MAPVSSSSSGCSDLIHAVVEGVSVVTANTFGDDVINVANICR